MRVGVLADVHGNLHALEGLLAALAPNEIDRYVVAGDLVGYGPHPNECIERVRSLEAVCVAGNHDLIVLGALSDERCIRLARESLRWTREVLSRDAHAYLAQLPRRARIGDLHIAHGALDDPEVYTRTADVVRPQLERIARESGASALLVLGHTHRPFAFSLGGGRMSVRAGTSFRLPVEPVLLNPGSVGQAREVRALARGLVLDVSERTARFVAVPYDVRGCRRALEEAGLSPSSCHLRPSPLRRALRLTRRATRSRRFRGR